MKCWSVTLAAIVVAGCGVVGPPLPPENVGVMLTIEQQKKSESPDALQRGPAPEDITEPDPALQGQDENLPPLRPVGTR
ncbi:MAG TPA: hypothetical protein VIU63_00555 [Nitrospira sp.]